MDISQWIERHAAFTPDKAAIRFEGKSISYAQFLDEIKRLAGALQNDLGVQSGDRVAVLATNIPEYLALLFACARIGAILNPLNWRLAAPELLYILENAGISILFVEVEFADVVVSFQQKMAGAQLVGFDFTPTNGQSYLSLLENASNLATPPKGKLEDILLLVYTSGTTGYPKGALLTQNALLWNSLNSQHMQDLTAQDHVLTPLPLFHVGGLNNQTMPALRVGGTVTLHRRFHPDNTLRAIENDKPTVTCLVPATMAACIASPLWRQTDFSALRLVVTGSTLVPTNLSDHFRDRGVSVVEMYGSTESCPIAIYQRPDSDFSKRGSTGLPALHCEAKVVDAAGNELPAYAEGEILIKGPNIMRGYWQNEAATAESLRDGWLHMGDIGYYDDDGYFFLKDRLKNMIISGGENIYAAEVERVLYDHPAVAECALIGMPDPKWGEKPVAIVVVKGGGMVSEAELRAFMDGKLARFKLPKAYLFQDELPKNVMGKIQHFLVREMLGLK